MVACAVLLSACGDVGVGVVPAGTAPVESASTAAAPPPSTAVAPDPEAVPAWSAIEAERYATDYMAALAAEAYEVAAWPIEQNGLVIEGQAGDETVAQALARLCGGGACRGPYAVEADSPGLVEPVSLQASSTVTVTEPGSGRTSTLLVATFEGQVSVTGLPPLVPSAGGTGLVEELFGGEGPTRVVVARLDAFELWTGDDVEWVPNPWAHAATQVEGDVMVASGPGGEVVAAVREPVAEPDHGCARLMSRRGEVLVLDQCRTDGWDLVEVASGEAREAPIPFEALTDGEAVWFTERGGAVVHGTADAEGNAVELWSGDGVDLLGGDWASGMVLSADGTTLAYLDHADPAADSHFYTPVVVVRDVATGAEVGRWTLGGPVLGLQLDGSWLVAAEAAPDVAVTGVPDQVALVAIELRTGAVRRVATPSHLFLPGPA